MRPARGAAPTGNGNSRRRTRSSRGSRRVSERIEGLAKEMYMLVGSQEPYVQDHATGEGPAMRAIREKMASTDWAKLFVDKKTMFSYGTEMSTDPVEAQFVKMLTYM